MASLNELTGALGTQKAAHLLRRVTFGPNIDQIGTFAVLTPAQAINQLFTDQVLPTPPIDTATGSSWVIPPTQNAAGGSNSEQSVLTEFFKAWHLDVMRQSGANIKERITWFYHTHLPVSTNVVESSEALYYQNCLFRHYAYGSFKELFKKIIVDNAMLRYIDGYTNHKDSPNENFAREMFELYSIGKGPQLAEGNYTNYSEDDIKAATRVLTGWTIDEDFENIDPGTNLPTGIISSTPSGTPNKLIATGHDGGTKTFTSLFDSAVISPNELINNQPTTDAAMQELDDMIEMIFGKIETARFITRKLYRSFVYHIITSEIETDIIQPLAQELYDNDYEIQVPLKTLLKSEYFYDADVITDDDINGALIKSPIEYTLGLMRFFNVTVPDRDSQTSQFYTDFLELVTNIQDQGIDYYKPFDVAGYDAYFQVPGYTRNWITSYALAYRYQLGDFLMKKLNGTAERSFKLDVLDWVENSGHISDPADADEIVDTLINNLFAVEITAERRNYFRDTVFLDTFNETTWNYEWTAYKNTNDDSVVRERIETLVSALIQTPEFQLS